MPRSPRLHIPAAFYHVTLRGNHRQNIFFTPADRRLFDDLTAAVLEQFTARLHAYCLMTNHVHLLVQVGDTPLGRLMLRIVGRYARAVQSRLHTTGHLFEKRYHPILVDADEYLLELLRTSTSIPSALIGSTVLPTIRGQVITPISARRRNPASPPTFHCACFIPSATVRSRRMSDSSIGASTHPPPHHSPGATPMIPASSAAMTSLPRCSALHGDPDHAKRFVDLIDEACQQFSVTTDALFSASGQRHLTKARAWIAHQAIILRIASLSEVARTFGRTEGVLRQSVKRHFNHP